MYIYVVALYALLYINVTIKLKPGHLKLGKLNTN